MHACIPGEGGGVGHITFSTGTVLQNTSHLCLVATDRISIPGNTMEVHDPPSKYCTQGDMMTCPCTSITFKLHCG